MVGRGGGTSSESPPSESRLSTLANNMAERRSPCLVEDDELLLVLLSDWNTFCSSDLSSKDDLAKDILYVITM